MSTQHTTSGVRYVQRTSLDGYFTLGYVSYQSELAEVVQKGISQSVLGVVSIQESTPLLVGCPADGRLACKGQCRHSEASIEAAEAIVLPDATNSH